MKIANIVFGLQYGEEEFVGLMKMRISLFIILVITSFFRYNIKPQLQTGNKLLTAAQTLYDKIGEIM